MPKIFLGVGHGGIDSGAVGNGFRESDLNLAIAKACRDVLKRHGVTVKMSREKDEYDPLEQEIAECNKFAPDYAIDIHNNAGGGDGVEIFHSYGSSKDDTLAKNVLAAIKAIGQNSRGLKTKLIAGTTKDWFGFVREIKAPSILVECAFVDTADIKIIDTAKEQKAMGEAIAKGILKTLGITYKKEAPTTFKVGDQVKITGAYAGSATGQTIYTYAKGSIRYITKIYTGKKNPYQLGIKKGNSAALYTTGFAPATSIKKV